MPDRGRIDIRIKEIEASAYPNPSRFPEADGTLTWNSTTRVMVKVKTPAGQGWGYTSADLATNCREQIIKPPAHE